MKNKTKFGFVISFLFVIMNIFIINVQASENLLTTTNISCDKTALKLGEKTRCVINFSTNEYLTRYQGVLKTQNGLIINKLSSLDSNYTLDVNDSNNSSFTLDAIEPSRLVNLDLVAVEVTRVGDIDESRFGIALSTKKNCDNTMMDGDIDEDGSVTLDDARKILNHFAKIETLSEQKQLKADVNKDGNIDSKDATLVLQMAHKYSGGFPTEKFIEGRGDVNGDGEVNATDSTLVLQRFSGQVNDEDLACVDDECSNADVNGDGEVNAEDATLILQYFANIIGSYTNDFYVCYAVGENSNDIMFTNYVEEVSAPDTAGVPMILFYVISSLLILSGIILIIKGLKKQKM